MTECKCCGKHVPLPVSYCVIRAAGKEVTLCPTTYDNVLHLLSQCVDGKMPAGDIRKHYSRYVRDLVIRILNSQSTNYLFICTTLYSYRRGVINHDQGISEV